MYNTVKVTPLCFHKELILFINIIKLALSSCKAQINRRPLDGKLDALINPTDTNFAFIKSFNVIFFMDFLFIGIQTNNILSTRLVL